MSQLMDSIRYLAKEIGPRPAGTSEEQQAALYLTEQLQKETGFSAGIEDFQRRTRPDLSLAILAAVVIVVSLVTMFVSALAIVGFILVAAAAAVAVIELLGTPLLSRALAKGQSQNVVAKYNPNPENEGGRGVSRKLILIAHYDSGHVTSPLSKRLSKWKVSLSVVATGAMVVSAVLMLLRIFIAISGGGLLVILNVVSVLALLVCALPLVELLLKRRAPLNEGANNNATGNAALIEVARRISEGSVSEADLAQFSDSVTIHGRDAAYEAGLVPEGAALSYEAESTESEATEAERLLAAKAAIAALTGKPVERRVYSSLAEESAEDAVKPDAGEQGTDLGELPIEVDSHGSITQIPDDEFATAFKEYRTGSIPMVRSDEHDAASNAHAAGLAAATATGAVQAAAASAAASEVESQDVAGFQNVPSWFAAAQKNAKKSASSASADIHRSRYTEAIENAERERIRQEQAAAEAAEAAREAERLAREAEAAAAIAAAAQERAQAAAAAKDAEAEAEAHMADATIAMPPEDTPAGTAVASTPASDEAVAETVAEVASAEDVAGSKSRREGPSGVRRSARDSAAQTESADEDLADALEKPASAAPASTSAAEQVGSSNRSDRLRNLRTNVPSLSGIIRTKDAARKAAVKSVPDVRAVSAPLGAPTHEGATAASRNASVPRSIPAIDQSTRIIDEPLTARRVPQLDPLSVAGTGKLEAVEIAEEARTSAPASDFNPQLEDDFAADLATDAPDEGEDFKAPVYQEVPRTKSEGFFSRFRHKRQDETMESPQEWLGVDDDFEARKVGRARGSWESFRTDDDDVTNPFTDESHDAFADLDGADVSQKRRGRRWEGGSASRHSLGHVDMRSGEDAGADDAIPDTPPEAEHNRFVTGEIERIYHFRNPAFNTEIWFVAIGCDNVDSHDGAYAFLEEHKAEMRGSTVIEVESLGAGTLSVAKREGAVRKVNASSRIKRYTRDVVARTGISLDEVDMSGTESIASIVQKAGFQSMHIFGAEDGRPALKGSADDVVENVDEVTLNDHVNFIYELLKR